MRHVPSSPAGMPAGGKTGYYAGQPITDRLQCQPRLKLTVLKHCEHKDTNLTLILPSSVHATHTFIDIE